MMKPIFAVLFLCASTIAVSAQTRMEKPVPYNTVLDAPGSYVLIRDLVTTGSEPALTIRANNVTVDLAGYQISGPGTNMGMGILVDGANGVRIRNGYIRDLGFGVVVMNSGSVTVEGLHINGRGIGVSAPPPEVGIMIVNSKAVTVKHNNLLGVGLGVFVRGPGSMGNHIYENTITATTNGLLGICYNPAPGAAGGPRGDTVERNAISGFRFSIQVNAGGPNIFRDNTLLYTMGAFEVTSGNVIEETNNTKVQLP
jgi:nitrous oxidase accessory protein NosD